MGCYLRVAGSAQKSQVESNIDSCNFSASHHVLLIFINWKHVRKHIKELLTHYLCKHRTTWLLKCKVLVRSSVAQITIYRHCLLLFDIFICFTHFQKNLEWICFEWVLVASNLLVLTIRLFASSVANLGNSYPYWNSSLECNSWIFNTNSYN